MDGPAEEVAEKYRWWSWNVAKGEADIAQKLLDQAIEEGEPEVVQVLSTSPARMLHPRHSSGVKRRRPSKPAEQNRTRNPVAVREPVVATDLLPEVSPSQVVLSYPKGRVPAARHARRK